MDRSWCRAARAVAASLALALAPGGAAAHAVLVESAPPDGGHVGEPPAEVVLRFSEPVVPVAVRLLDAGGEEVPGVAVEPRGESVTLRPGAPLAEGAYLVSYRVVSADGHPVGATLRFGVGAAAASEAAGAASRAPAAAGLFARWLFYVGALGAAGAALFVPLARPPAALAARVRRLAVLLAAAGVAGAAARLGTAGLELTGAPAAALAGAGPWAAALGTSLGRAAAVAVAGLAVLGGAAAARADRLAVLGAATVGGSFALTGHAASAGPAWLTAPAVAVHALGGAFWLGSLVPLAWALRLPAAEAAAVLRRFSAAATAAVAALALAGAGLAWAQLGGAIAPLWETAYGLRLAVKLALVACLLGLAAVNRLALTPALARGEAAGRRRLRATLLADMVLGLGVLGLTASLPLDPPPRALAHGSAAVEAAEDGVAVVVAAPGGARAVLTLLPGQPGANRLEGWVTGPDGTPLTAREAQLRLGLPEAGIEPARFPAAMTRPGVYVADGLPVARPGRWRLRLELLVDDFTRLAFEGDLMIR
jgi:copper transport protein